MLCDDVTCSIISHDNSVIAKGHKRGNLYVLDGAADRRPDEAMVAPNRALICGIRGWPT